MIGYFVQQKYLKKSHAKTQERQEKYSVTLCERGGFA